MVLNLTRLRVAVKAALVSVPPLRIEASSSKTRRPITGTALRPLELSLFLMGASGGAVDEGAGSRAGFISTELLEPLDAFDAFDTLDTLDALDALESKLRSEMQSMSGSRSS